MAGGGRAAAIRAKNGRQRCCPFCFGGCGARKNALHAHKIMSIWANFAQKGGTLALNGGTLALFCGADAFIGGADAFFRSTDAFFRGADAFTRSADAFTRGADAFTRSTDAKNGGTDAFTSSTDAFTCGADAKNGGTEAFSTGAGTEKRRVRRGGFGTRPYPAIISRIVSADGCLMLAYSGSANAAYLRARSLSPLL